MLRITDAQWDLIRKHFPEEQQWCENEVIRAALTELANVLRDEGSIDESECYIDATFASAKGGGEQIGATKRGKGVKIMAIVDRHGPLYDHQGTSPRYRRQ